MLKTPTTTKQAARTKIKQSNYLNVLASSSVSMVLINDRKAYIPVLSCIINLTSKVGDLNNPERLFYLLATMYAKLNYSINFKRTTEKSGKEWGRLLNRSEQHVFQMQKNLERLGYFIILREKDEDNQNEKNIITPTLPDKVFEELMKEPNRANVTQATCYYEGEYKLSYLDDSKMFIKLNLPMFLMVLENNSLSSLQKLIWVYFFYRSYISYNDQNGNGIRNFITNYQEISAMFSCSESTVSIAINKLYKEGFITKKQFRLKDQTKFGRRKKKSCWEICALIPEQQMKELLRQKDRQNLAPLTLDDFRLYGSSCITNTSTPSLPKISCSYNGEVHDQTSNEPLKAQTYVKNDLKITAHSLATNNCNLHNSCGIEADPYKNMQYYNKNNILNIKNNVDEQNYLANNNSPALEKELNVFSAEKLFVSNEELACGLSIAAKFEEEVFQKPKEDLVTLEETIKKVDLIFSAQEHWVVTKSAFTLHQKLETEVLAQYGNKYDDFSIIKLKEQLFSPAEERLVSLWESFSDLPSKAEQEEFLIRKSWLLRLLPNYSNKLKSEQIEQQTSGISPRSPIPTPIPELPGDKADKAKKFAKKLLVKGVAKGYAASLSTKDLADEFIYHAANWVPARLNCATREEQIDAALSVAWRAVEQGRWQCPYRLLNLQIQQRELEAAAWKNR